MEMEPATRPVPPHGVSFPVVGIGASAGGYAALTALLRNTPAGSSMAFVVILHLSSEEPSAADKLLQRASGMPVVQVTHTMPILPDHVYVIPPDRSLVMQDGHLVLDQLDQLDRSRGRPVAIDLFLRTLADAHMEHAIGIVLSGMGSDGTAGLARIREAGGVTIVQLPEDAQQDGMPRSAIESGMADFILAAADIPRKLLALRDISNAMRRQAAGAQPAGTTAERAALHDVLSVLHERTGHDFSGYKRPTGPASRPRSRPPSPARRNSSWNTASSAAAAASAGPSRARSRCSTSMAPSSNGSAPPSTSPGASRKKKRGAKAKRAC